MLRQSRSADLHTPLGDDGSAPIEFVFVGLILLVPIVYLVVALAAIQEQTLGAEAAARHIARSIAEASDPTSAETDAQEILASVIDEYGMDSASVSVALSCPDGGECPRAGATVVVRVGATVTLPLVPSILGLDTVAAVPIEAFSAQRVSRFWGTG